MFYEYCKSGKFVLMLHQIPKSVQRQELRKVGVDKILTGEIPKIPEDNKSLLIQLSTGTLSKLDYTQ